MATNFLLKRSGTASKRPEAASMALGELDLNYDASTGGIFYKDSSGGVVKVGPAQVGSTAPNASPAGSAGNSVGEFWYDTTSTVLKIWNGSSWVDTLPAATPTTFGTVLGCTTEFNTYIGCNAGHPDGTSGNIAIGDSALGHCTGYGNITDSLAIGYCTLQYMAEGGNNIALGNKAMQSATGGNFNIAIGENSLNALTLGGSNVAVGGLAGWCLVDGASNVAIGEAALACSTFVSDSTAIGTRALFNAQGNRNTAIGWLAGCDLTSGSCNIIVGSYTGVAAPINETGSNHVVLSDGDGVVRLATNENGALSFDGIDYGTANQILVSNGSGAAPTWETAGGGGGGVTSISGTAPVTVDNTNPATPVVGVTAASTTAAGVVQLINSSGSTSCTLAPTANILRLVNATASAAIPCSRYFAKGSLLVGQGVSNPANLPVGTEGQILTVCSASIWGVAWAAGGGGGGSGTVTDITAGTGLTGGTITTTGTIALDTACVIQPSLLTGKGSIIGASGSSTPVEVGGGADGLVLTACGACPSGLTWAAACVTPTPATPTVAGAVFGFTDLSDGNTALGQCALAGGNASAANVAIGKLALQSLTSNCSWNVAVGYAALNCATTAEFNTAVGGGALWCNTTGMGNTAIGSNTLFENNGSYNIAIGSNTAFSYAGCSSIFIGTSVVPDPGDCQLVISSGGNTWVRGYSDGAVKFGGGIVDYGGSCGTLGQVLTAVGGNGYTWCDLPAAPTGATGTFTSQEGCTITVTNGLITSIV